MPVRNGLIAWFPVFELRLIEIQHVPFFRLAVTHSDSDVAWVGEGGSLAQPAGEAALEQRAERLEKVRNRRQQNNVLESPRALAFI